MATNAAAKRGLGALIKQGWNEIPEVMGSSVIALIGIGLGGFGLYRYYANDGDNRRYKMGYVVYRPDDPRALKVHKDDKDAEKEIKNNLEK